MAHTSVGGSGELAPLVKWCPGTESPPTGTIMADMGFIMIMIMIVMIIILIMIMIMIMIRIIIIIIMVGSYW